MRVGLVLAPQNAGWVIGKIAQRLGDALSGMGHEVRIDAAPDCAADVNHWMSFAFADGCPGTVNTMFVTHADDPYKVKLIKDLVATRIQMALCMSPHAMNELAALGVPAGRLWYVLPALDAPLARRRICIGITTRTYDDGRKREAFLERLAGRMKLDRFHFAIYGSGWERVAAALRTAGATVHLDPGSDDWQGDYARIRQAMPDFDYYLYLGMDEGSLGTLDAVSAGVRTIVTAQGFHMALPGGIDHPFTDYDEMETIFSELSSNGKSRDLAQWTWDTYAREHVGIWQAILLARGVEPQRSSLMAAMVRAPSGEAGQIAGPIASNSWRFRARMLQPARVRGAFARLRWLRPLRRLIGQ